MDSKLVINKIKSITPPQSNYTVFASDNGCCYYGLNSSGELVFLLPSQSYKALSLCQETKSLKFLFNKNCSFNIDGVVNEKFMHLLICKDRSEDTMEAFIRLTYAFANQNSNNDQYYLPKLFSSISSLFDKDKDVSQIELQGLYGELYTIWYFYNHGINLANFWQSKNKMKFDFSLSDKKRLEIKTTLKNSRVHHFHHDQLLSELYDIKVVSIMLQRNDYGMSLKELIGHIRTIYSDIYPLMLRIDSIATHISEQQLEELKYDNSYTENNIKFFSAEKIPHFNEKNPEGVFNAEYDCCLDNIESMLINEIKDWLTVQN